MKTYRGNAEGIDVSDNNGVFPWPKWEGHIDFAGIKVSEGLFWDAADGSWTTSGNGSMWLDPQFARNADWAKELDLHRLFYHFGHPAASPVVQARDFADILDDRNLENGRDAVVLDFEVTDGMKILDVAFWGWAFMRELDRKFKRNRKMVYTFPYFIEQGNCAKLGGRHLWIANYDTPEPDVPKPFDHWDVWQYASSASGGVDRDVFNGDKTALAHFLKV